MRSLRTSVLLGAFLWTLGLLSVETILITIYSAYLYPIRIVHQHAHLMGVLAILTAIAGFAVVRSGLAPLDELRRRLRAIQGGAERRLQGRYPSEVQPLVDDMNALLAHQEQAVQRALAKAGDLAHGLKTPLAVMSQDAQRAAAAGQSDLATALGEQIERMRRQIEYHLAHARAAASGANAGARCSIAASAEPLARTLLRLYAGRGITIGVLVSPDHEVRCQREDLDEMLGNLLDNACKWATSRVVITSMILPPEGGRHESEGGSHEPAVTITVDDDGPGLPETMRDAVLQRGVRVDEAAPGSGLGLAIVGDLAAVYGGTIGLEAGSLGGLRARLRLPSPVR
jgi:signal transduction histidine kinase